MAALALDLVGGVDGELTCIAGGRIAQGLSQQHDHRRLERCGLERSRDPAQCRPQDLLVRARRVSDGDGRCCWIEAVAQGNVRQFGKRALGHVDHGRGPRIRDG
jgi:hypothetical protein